jgi:BirA family transcriptional regulator, biotin operon repressor / biotin---[acetyl-CoA-carboxylase] ligase
MAPDRAEPGAPRGDGAGGEVTADTWLAAAIDALDEVDSTNRYALALAANRPGRPVVVTAEHQTAGRGRRGRSWVDDPGGALLASFVFWPDAPPERFGLLTLAVACAACDAIERATSLVVGLKWPNDLVVGDAKLGGVLGEVGGPFGSATPVVVGIGLNLAASPALTSVAGLDGRPPISVAAAGAQAPSAAALLDELRRGLDRRGGPRPGIGNLAAVREEAVLRTVTIGRRVAVHRPDAVTEGVARGITETGALEVVVGSSVQTFAAGDVVHLR